MTMTSGLDYLVRLAGVAALALGLALWTGHLYGLVTFHMALGVVAVLGLWALAILALRRGAARGIAALALLWGVATIALGVSQTGLVLNGLHWLVQVAHLLLGLVAIALAAFLAGSMRRSAAT